MVETNALTEPYPPRKLRLNKERFFSDHDHWRRTLYVFNEKYLPDLLSFYSPFIDGDKLPDDIFIPVDPDQEIIEGYAFSIGVFAYYVSIPHTLGVLDLWRDDHYNWHYEMENPKEQFSKNRKRFKEHDQHLNEITGRLAMTFTSHRHRCANGRSAGYIRRQVYGPGRVEDWYIGLVDPETGEINEQIPNNIPGSGECYWCKMGYHKQQLYSTRIESQRKEIKRLEEKIENEQENLMYAKEELDRLSNMSPDQYWEKTEGGTSGWSV